MATPKKLPSGSWRAQGFYKDPVTGKVSRPSFTAATKAEAARMVAEYQATRERASKSIGLTVGECIARYIDARRATLSPSTARVYIQMQRLYYDSIAKIPLHRLTDEDLQIFVSDMTRAHSPKTVRNVYGLLSSAISMFSDRVYHVQLPAKNAIERNIPNDEEVKRLMELATPTMRLCIALAAFGTLRRGEIPALKYKDILRDQNAIYVHADFVRSIEGEFVYKEHPKTTSSIRIVPLPPQIIEMMGDGDPEEYIVKMTPAMVGKNFINLRNAAGMKCRFHDLRHYAASIMHALGVPDQYIMERGGWKSDAVLKSIYRNTLSDQSKKFADLTNDHFSGLL